MKLPVLPADKANHFVYGAVIAAAGGLYSPLAGVALCGLAAFGKEFLDSKGHGTPSVADALWTIAGGAVVLLPFAPRVFQ